VCKEVAMKAITFMEDRQAVSSKMLHGVTTPKTTIMNNNCRGNIRVCAGVTYNVTLIQGVTSVGYNMIAERRLVERVAVYTDRYCLSFRRRLFAYETHH
jgi:hypothetical protein